MSAENATRIILGFVIVAIIVASLWGTFENAMSNLQTAWTNSTFADVKNTLPNLAPLVPLLFGLAIIIGLIFAAIRTLT